MRYLISMLLITLTSLGCEQTEGLERSLEGCDADQGCDGRLIDSSDHSHDQSFTSATEMSVLDQMIDAYIQVDQELSELDMSPVDMSPVDMSPVDMSPVDMSPVDMSPLDESVISSCSDGIQNGAEVDVDCGGACDPCVEPTPEECLEENGGCGPSEYISCSVDELRQVVCTPLVEQIEYPQASDSFADRHFKVLIIMVNTLGEIPETSEPNASGLQEYYSAEELGDAYFELPTGVRSFIREASYNKVDLYGTVLGWFHTEPQEINDLQMMGNREEYFEWACYMVDCSEYDIFVLNGLASQGGAAIGWGMGNSLRVAQGHFMNVGFDYMINSSFLVHGEQYSEGLLLPNGSWPHELLHTLGVSGHSNSLWCSEGGVETSLSGQCENKAYGGAYSVMGEKAFATHPNAVMKKKLAWLDDHQIQNVDVTASFQSTRAVIYPFTSAEDNVKAVSVRLPRAINVAGLSLDRLTIEYRTPDGLDDYLLRLDGADAPDGGQFLRRYTDLPDIDRVGALLYIDIEYDGSDTTWDLDAHPGTSYNPNRGIKWPGNPGRFADAFLNVGETLSSPSMPDVEIEALPVRGDGGLELEIRCVGDRCQQALCGENERVSDGECVFCPAGTSRAAGDDPSAGDTSCTPIPCPDQSIGDLLINGCRCDYAQGWRGSIYAQRLPPGYLGGCERQ